MRNGKRITFWYIVDVAKHLLFVVGVLFIIDILLRS